MATKIAPIVFPLNIGTATLLDVRCSSFKMDDIMIGITYELKREIPIEELLPGVSPIQIIYSGRLQMMGVDYQNWGFNNQYVIDWVAQQLGITLLLSNDNSTNSNV